MNQPEDNLRSASTRKREITAAATAADGYDHRQASNDAMLGLISDERRAGNGDLRAGRGGQLEERSNPDFAPARNGDFPQQVYRNERQPRRAREVEYDEFDMPAEYDRSMATHQLFRGLLQELPPRSSPPSKEWLDKWAATSRSILELLYSRDSVI